MKKPNLSLRTSRPQSLTNIFGALSRAFGMRASDSDLAARWDEIMGDEIAQTARFVGLSRATPGRARSITVRATNPAAALTLTYQKSEIIARANKYFGHPAIDKVVVKK